MSAGTRSAGRRTERAAWSGARLDGMTDDAPGRGGRLRRALSRLAAPAVELEAEELRGHATASGCTELANCVDRQRATVRGTLRTVTLRPRAGLPALEAELYDGTGVVELVWMGRRRIAGIDCGRAMVANGRISTVDGRRVMFNPSYQLLPSAPA